MSRASALEVRWAPGKRDARAHWGPVLQRLRTIGRSAPVSGRALAHARPRAQPLGALRPGAGVVGRPDPGQAERTPGAITPTALGALHNRVAEAQEDAHRREAAPPGALRPFPAVGAHGREAGGGRQRVGLLGTRAGGGLQRVGGGRLGHGRAEHAAAAYRGRHRDCRPQGPGGLLVGQHVCGELLGLRAGAAHDGGPSPGHRGPGPVQRVASEPGDPGVTGHAPGAQREGLCHCLGPTPHGGQEERRPDQAHPGCSLALKAPAPALWRAGPALVMPHEARGEAGGTQLRMLATDLWQRRAEAIRSGHARGVVLFLIERHTETLASGWCHGVSPYGAVCSLHSMGPEVESSYCLPRLFANHEIRWTQEQAYRFGEKPVTPALVHATLVPDMHALEPTLTRYGYNVTALSEFAQHPSSGGA